MSKFGDPWGVDHPKRRNGAGGQARLATAGQRSRGAEHLEEELALEEIDGGYLVAWVALGVVMSIRQLTDGRDGPTGELTVERAPEGHLFGARFALGALRDRGDVAAHLQRLDGSADWPRLLEAFCLAVGRQLDLVADARARAPAHGNAIDAADLLALDLPPLRWIVPDLIPEGTFVLAGPPKVGKSCFVYQVVAEIAIGGELFGRRVTPGAVLYLALEDGQRRGQDRLRAALAGRTMPRGRLEVAWSAPKIGEGLEEMIGQWLDGHPDAALVAIDTLGRVRPRSDGRRGAYELDIADLSRLQSLFKSRPTALGIVHHTKKDAGDDFLANVSGTYGITGSADTIIAIKRVRLERFGTIVVTGREVAETEVPVRFDDMLWHEAPQSLPEASFARAEVYQAIIEHGPIWPAAIAKLIGHESRTSVQNMTTELYKTGAVARGRKGYAAVDREHEPSRAHARASLPHDSSDWESHPGQGGHTRAPAREGQPMPSVPCSDYRAHQGAHRQLAPGVWGCDTCSGIPA